MGIEGVDKMRSSAPLGVPQRNENVAYWLAFLVLGIRRCQTLLSPAGVPETMANDPAPLLAVAQDFLRRVKALDVSLKSVTYSGYLAYQDRVIGLTESALVRLAELYGQEAAHELHQWMRRFVVAEAETARWDAWALLFPHLAGFRGALAVQPPLSPGATKKFIETVGVWMGDLEDAFARTDAAIDHAAQVPLSADERRFLTTEGLERGEQDLGSDLDTARNVIRLHRPYAVWVALDDWLSHDEREALIRWADEEGSRPEVTPSRYGATLGLPPPGEY